MGKGSGGCTKRQALTFEVQSDISKHEQKLLEKYDHHPIIRIKDSKLSLAKKQQKILEFYSRKILFKNLIFCPTCKTTLKIEDINQEIKKSMDKHNGFVCHQCRNKYQEFLNIKNISQFRQYYSSYNQNPIYKVNKNSAVFWECPNNHIFRTSYQSFSNNFECRGCQVKWNKEKLAAHMLPYLLEKEKALTKQEWFELFQKWGLIENQRRGQQVDAYAHILSSFDKVVNQKGDKEKNAFPDFEYRTQLQFALNFPTLIDNSALDVNLRALGGNISFSKKYRKQLWQASGKKCQNIDCKYHEYLPFEKVHIDHIMPVSRGGSAYEQNNLQVLCADCNLSKSNKTMQEWLGE